MRFIHTATLELHEFSADQSPQYATLSHRWGENEPNYQDFRKKRNCSGPGYQKVVDACKFAREDGREWLWIDTVCIDKRSSAELTEAVNSMYKWYRWSCVCYAYLADVRSATIYHRETVMSDVRQSHWFKRGWTLQELLAPRVVRFCAQDWSVIGEKSNSGIRDAVDIVDELGEITGIPQSILNGTAPADEISVATKMSWASGRKTSRIEDTAYCLMGLFDVNMPLLYGEGDKAFLRLQQEIMNSSTDESLLAWDVGIRYQRQVGNGGVVTPHGEYLGNYHALATSPSEFAGMTNIDRYVLFEAHSTHASGWSPRFALGHGGLVHFRPDRSTNLYKLANGLLVISLRCSPGTGVKNYGAELISRMFSTFAESKDYYCLILVRRSCGHYERLHLEDPLDARYQKIEWHKFGTEEEVYHFHASRRCH